MGELFWFVMSISWWVITISSFLIIGKKQLQLNHLNKEKHEYNKDDISYAWMFVAFGPLFLSQIIGGTAVAIANFFGWV